MSAGTVETVLGPVGAAELGPTLVHEHLFVGWPGWSLDPLAEDSRTTQYGVLLERLRQAHAVGVRTVVDASPAELGRSAPFLQRVSRDSGLHVIASTGIYHEAWGFPVYMKMRSTAELSSIFEHELTAGIDGTDAKAGVIKVASAGAAVGRHERKALEAAAAAAISVRAAVITHSSNAEVALDQAATLTAAGVPPERIQIGHCDSYAVNALLKILDTGVFVAFDQCVYEAKIDVRGRASALSELLALGYRGQLTLSHDQIGLLGGRQIKLAACTPSFTYIRDRLIPELVAKGVDPAAIDTILIDNPRRLLCGAED